MGHHALDRCAQHVCFCLTKLLTVRTGGATCTQTIAHHAVHLVQHRRPITAIVLQRLETDPSRRVGFVCQFVLALLQHFNLCTKFKRCLSHLRSSSNDDMREVIQVHDHQEVRLISKAFVTFGFDRTTRLYYNR